MAEPAPRFLYDSRLRRYRSPDGRFVREDAILKALREVTEAQGQAGRRLGESLLRGEVTLAEWQKSLAAVVKEAHVVGAMAARGGRAHMSQADWGSVGARVKGHYRLLRAFAEQVASGAQPPNGHVIARAQNYGRAGWGAYQAMAQRAAEQGGEAEERNVLGGTDRHCAGCLAEDGQGWVAVGTLVPPGSRRPCGSNCRCTLRFRDALAATAARTAEQVAA